MKRKYISEIEKKSNGSIILRKKGIDKKKHITIMHLKNFSIMLFYTHKAYTERQVS